MRFQTRTIIEFAMLEGPAFLAIIAFLIEGRWEALGIAAFLLVAMALSFPFEERYRAWFGMNVRSRDEFETRHKGS